MARKWLPVALKLLVSAALIWLVLSKVDLAESWARLAQVSALMLAAVVGLFGLQIVICGFRWRAVLRPLGGGLSYPTMLRLFYIGAFFNQTLPSSVGGDAVRGYLAYRRGIGLRAAINGIMLERAATVAGLVLLVAATQPAFLPRVGGEAGAWIGPTVALCALGMVVGIGLLATLDRLPARFQRWRLVRGLGNLAADTRRVFFRPGPCLAALGWSVAGHLNLTLAVFVLARGLELDVGFIDCLALFPPVLLLTAIPLSIAGWGVREGGMVVAFGLIGVPAEGALVLSLLFGLIVLASSLPGGLVWLASGAERREARAALKSEKRPETIPAESEEGVIGPSL